MSRKPRKCRICKKRPVWTGGDVKDPGPFCKQCYHKRSGRTGRAPAKAREPNAIPVCSPRIQYPSISCWIPIIITGISFATSMTDPQ